MASNQLVKRRPGSGGGGITSSTVSSAIASAIAPLYAQSFALLPWAAKTITSGSFVVGANDGGLLLQFGTAQNSEIAWDINLLAGTYMIGFTQAQGSDRGIYSVQLNDVQVGTADGYNAGSAYVLSTVSAIAVATSGANELSLKMLTKNASSSSYKGIIGGVMIARTGA